MTDLTITIHAILDNFPIDLQFTGTVEQLPAITKRLRALGASEPVSAPASPAPKPKAPRVQPTYAPNGDPCCPDHGTPLREGKWGLFCPTKDKQSGEYCRLKFNA